MFSKLLHFGYELLLLQPIPSHSHFTSCSSFFSNGLEGAMSQLAPQQVDDAGFHSRSYMASAKPTDEVLPVVHAKKIPLPRDLNEVPPVAWPTVILSLTAVSMVITGHLAYGVFKAIDYPPALLLISVGTYWAFTPMHDAAHRSIATKKSGMQWLNGAIGAISSIPFAGGWLPFRFIHLEHHKYTNVPGRDPDLWAAGISDEGQSLNGWTQYISLPFRWATLMLHYLAWYSLRITSRPAGEAVATAIFILHAVYHYTSWLLPLPEPFKSLSVHMFWCFVIPITIAQFILGFAFDYLPHRPSVAQDVYRGTHLLTLSQKRPETDAAEGASYKTDNEYITMPLTLPLLYQNYHVIHHMYPWIPFYRYSPTWYRMEQQLREKGVAMKSLFPVIVKK